MSPLDLRSPLGATLALLPEVVLTASTLVVLLLVAWRHQGARDSQLAGWCSLVGVALAGAALALLWLGGARPAGLPHMTALDPYRFGAAAIILGITAGTILLSLRYLVRQRLVAPEYYVLVLLAATGMLFLAGAADMITLFLGLEVMSVAVYVLAGFDRFRRSSAEAALKYFLIGAFASAFLLYGIALIFGATGETNLTLIGQRLGRELTPMARLGLALLLIGFMFKVAVVPFHMWAPDVYDGAPTPVTGFMATGVKAAAFVALVRVLMEAFPAASAVWQPVIAVLAIATMILGNVVALAQRSLKRLLAYSSIAHAGYALVGVWAGTTLGAGAVLLYLFAYSVVTLASFGVVAAIEHVGSHTVLVDDLEGLYSVRPWASLSLSICLLSLLGFPGTFGFIGKWYLIAAAVAEQQYILPVVLVLGSLVSAGYYLPVIMAMTMKPTRTPEAHRQVAFSWAARATVALAVAVTLALGVWPAGPLAGALESAAALARSVAGR
ncbi:MAG TPA: NADH-quinone oxidoreductase subunit N [Gemmatimonadales bacterium]|nr:NADH-quinone oxidoreductase subunit N [Gemmatimonadales bacterium]